MRYYNYVSDDIEGGGYGNANMKPMSGMNSGMVDAGAAGASGFAAGGPIGAGIGVAGSFLSQYLAQRAQEEAQRKQAQMNAAQYEGDAKTGALRSMLSAYSQALR